MGIFLLMCKNLQSIRFFELIIIITIRTHVQNLNLNYNNEGIILDIKKNASATTAQLLVKYVKIISDLKQSLFILSSGVEGT